MAEGTEPTEDPFVIPPRASWWHRNIATNADTIREFGFGGLAFACALGAWFCGGDMQLIVPALILGFVLAAIGIATIPIARIYRILLVVTVFCLLVAEGAFLRQHFLPPTKAAADPPTQAPPPPPAKPPAKPPLVSTFSKMILVCDSPKLAKAPSLAERKAVLAEKLDVLKKIFGADAKGNVADNEQTLSVAVNTPTGSVKQDWVVKRTGDKLYFSITSQLGTDNALSFIFALAALAPLDPDTDYAKQVKEKVEQAAEVEPGKCKFL
jgi:hypothetical protein